MKNPNGKIIRINRSPSFWSPRAQLAGMLAACLGLVSVPVAQGASGTWTNDASSVWSGSTNWLGGVIADGPDATADFSTLNPGADRTVTLDSTRSAGVLRFSGGTGSYNWFLNSSSGSPLNLSASSGLATVAVTNTATINAALGGAAGLTKTGNGTLILGGTNTYAGATAISNGTLRLPAPSVNAATVPTPVLYLSFDNVVNGTNIVNDGSGGPAMNGVLVSNATIVANGRLGGNCLQIPALLNSGYVLVTNSVVLFNGTNNWTVALWMKTTVAGAVYLYQGNGGWNNTGGANTIFHLSGGGNQSGGAAGNGLDGRGVAAGGVSYGRGWEAGSLALNDGNWHFVVMTCDTNNTKISYVDGQVDAWNQDNWSGPASGTNLWIGGCGETGDGTAGLNGLIDEVSIYNRTLSRAEVQTLMAAGTVPSSSALSVASTLDLNGRSQVVAGLSGGGTVDSTLAGGSAALVVNNSSATASSFSGVLANSAGSLSLVKAGTNSLTLNGAAASTYTGATTVNGGLLIEDFANATSPANLINSASPLVLGGGTLQVKQQSATPTSQTFSGTTLNPGASRIIGTQVGSGALTIALGAITQSVGGTVDFTNTSTGYITTTLANTNGILGGWATMGNSVSTLTNNATWAANDGSGNIVPFTGFTVLSATASQTANWSSTSTNQNWVCGALNGANYITGLTNNTTVNSLVVQGDFNVNANVTGGTTLTLGSGGLMLRGGSRWILNNNGGNVARTNFLKSGLPTGELYVHVPSADASANNWTIWPVIADGSVPTMLVKDGPGLLKLGSTNTYTGGTMINGGTLQLGNSSAGGPLGVVRGVVTVNPGAALTLSRVDSLGYTAGSSVNAININYGVVSNTSSGNEGYLTSFNLTGGTMVSSGGNYVFSAQNPPVYGINSFASPVMSLISAPIHFNGLGFFNVASGTTPNGVDLTVSGVINYSTNISKNGTGSILLSGANTFTGGWSNNAGTTIIGNAAAFGTGLLTVNGGSISNNTGSSFTVANTVALPGAASFGVASGDTLTLSGVISGSGSLSKAGAGTLKLSNADIFSGNTAINGGTLTLTGSGSLANSPNIIVGNGGTFDVSAVTFALVNGQSLQGGGTNIGSIATVSGSKIFAGTDGGYGTNTINGNLTLASGAACYFDLGTAFNGANDQIVVAGNLTNNNNLIHIKAPSTLASLDQTADYVLFTVAGTISGSFAIAPVWDVAPANSTHYRIVTGANTVTLHYDPTLTAPSGTGTAAPATLTRNQSTVLTVNVILGTYPVSTVVVDASPIGASSSVLLVQSNSTPVYTNTVVVSPVNAVGSKALNAIITDSSGFFGALSIPVTVTAANQVWGGGSSSDNNWSSNPNWVSGAAPAYAGDSVEFAGTTRLAPVLDTNYSVTAFVFDSTAGSFTISAAGANALTLATSTLVNNSTSAQTLNVPLVLAAPENFNAASGSLTLGGAVTNSGYAVTVSGSANTVLAGPLSGSGALAKVGNGTLIISSTNSFSGATTVNGGTLTVSATGSLLNSPSLTVNTSTVVVSGLITNNALDTVGSAAGNSFLTIAGGTLRANYPSGQLYSSSLQVGTAAGALGDITMTSGALIVNEQLALGAGSYAAFNQSGGSNTIGGFIALGGTTNGAVFNQSGGTVNLTGCSATIGFSVTNAVGLMDLSGTAVFNANPNGGTFGGGIWVGEVGTGMLNIFDKASLVIPADGVSLGKANAAASGTVNLLGGTLTASFITNGPGAGAFNFNGGTLKAAAATTTFTLGTAASTTFYDYSGGAVIDDGGYAVTFNSAIMSPSGYGVASIPVSSGGAGYIDAPVVLITNISASGSGATAIAQIDPSAGTITNLLVTCPGQGYGSSDTLGVDIRGGGGSGAAFGTAVLVESVSGGLTKLGAGTLALSSGNSYTNATAVRGGTLILNSGTMSTPGNLIVSNAIAYMDATGGSVTVNNLILQSNANLTLSYGSLGGNPGFTAVVVNGTIISSGTNIINLSGSGFALGQFPLISYAGTALSSISNFKLGSLPTGISATLVNNTANNTIDLDITLIGQSLTWYGADSSGNLKTSWDINTTLDWNSGTLAYLEYAANTFGDFVTFDDSLYNQASTNVIISAILHPSTITESSSLPYSITGAGSLAGAGTLTLSGSGSLTLGTSNSFTGGTAISAGTLVLSNAAALGTGPLTITGGTLDSQIPNLVNAYTNLQYWNGDFTFLGSQSLSLGMGSVTLNANRQLTINSNTLTVPGSISGGAVTLTKSGAGTLALTGTNFCTGKNVVYQGAIALSGAGLMAFGTDVSIGANSGLAGAFYQSGSTTVSNSDTGGGAFQIGATAGAAGYYNLASGTVNLAGEINIGGFSGGSGTFGQLDLLGGTINIPNRQAGTYFLVNRSFDGGEAAVVNVLGGTVQVANSGYITNGGFNGLAINWSSASGNVDTAAVTIGNGGQILTPSIAVKLNMGTNYNGLTGNSANAAVLNLNSGGLLQTLGFVNGTGNNTNVFVNFNGGTLKAGTAANTAFLGGLGGAYVYGGGAIIDDNSQAITMAQTLLAATGSGISSIAVASAGAGYIAPPQVVITDDTGVGATAYATVDPASGAVTGIVVTSPGVGYTSPSVSLTGIGYTSEATVGTVTLAANSSGGLVKNGSGTLTLNGTNNYSGATVVNAGELIVSQAHQGTGALRVAGGAAFGVNLTATGAVSAASLTLGSGATTLDFTFASTNGIVPVLVAGPFTNNGICSVRISGQVAVGAIPLIHYTGTIAGGGSFNTNLTLPRGVVATISNSVSAGIVYAVVTQTGAGLIWAGTSPVNPNLWDIGVSTNWLVGSAPAVYLQTVAPGDAVSFTDSGSGSVTLNTSVSPASVVISNNSTAYQFLGSGHITGTAGLVKNGPGSVTMGLAGNTYTGNTTISNGTFQLGATNAIPNGGVLAISPGAKVDLNGNSPTIGALTLGGIIDNSSGTASVLTMGATNGKVVWNGFITNTGAGGTSFIESGSNSTEVVVKTVNYLSGASASEVNGGALLITNGGALYMSGSAEFWVGQGAGSAATVIVDGGVLVTSNNWLVVGRADATASGTLIVNHGLVQKAGNNNLVVGSLGATGYLYVNGGQVLNNGNLWLGEDTGANAYLYLNGGLLQASQVRANGTTPTTSAAYFNGGTLQATASSGDFIASPVSAIIQSNGLVLDDGGFVLSNTSVAFTPDGSTVGGGLIKQGAGTLYLNTANTYTGTTLVTNGTLAGIGSVAGPVVVAPAGTLGAGDDASNIGIFTINNNLVLKGNASFRVSKTGGTAAQDAVVISGNLTYGGVLTVTNITSDSTALTTSDQFQLFSVSGTTSGNFSSIVGSPGAGLAFAFTPSSGILSIVTSIPTNPTNITCSLSGNTLTLSWPADHIGWVLQAQTNTASTGLAPSGTWVDVPNSSSVGTNVITINPANPTVFFRLRYP